MPPLAENRGAAPANQAHKRRRGKQKKRSIARKKVMSKLLGRCGYFSPYVKVVDFRGEKIKKITVFTKSSELLI